jgi:hypothetical protein
MLVVGCWLFMCLTAARYGPPTQWDWQQLLLVASVAVRHDVNVCTSNLETECLVTDMKVFPAATSSKTNRKIWK